MIIPRYTNLWRIKRLMSWALCCDQWGCVFYMDKLLTLSAALLGSSTLLLSFPLEIKLALSEESKDVRAVKTPQETLLSHYRRILGTVRSTRGVHIHLL
jgi:hypothetical protein